MKIKIVAVGKLKEKFYIDAVLEYAKRISRFAKFEIVEVAEHKFLGTPNEKEILQIKTAEGKQILELLEGFVVAMDIDGKTLGSVEVAKLMEKNLQNFSCFTFVVGGTFGLADEVKSIANLRWSFGAITLPHQLARVVLTEQIYRVLTINNNITYHN